VITYSHAPGDFVVWVGDSITCVARSIDERGTMADGLITPPYRAIGVVVDRFIRHDSRPIVRVIHNGVLTWSSPVFWEKNYVKNHV
jgi:hypothetical protein